MADEPLYFVQISDTHIGPTPGYSRHGHVALPCAQRAVDLINRLPTRPDFVVHTGDVTTDPSGAAYRLAAETFADLRPPIYYVNGNHDRAVDIGRYLALAPHDPLVPGGEELAYAFSCKGYDFLVLDSRGPDAIDPRGRLSEAQLTAVRERATADGPPLTVFVHHPPLPMNAPWMDENMLIENGLALHEALLPARDRLRGVFYGHVHQPMQTWRDGILYVAAASIFSQFAAWPADEWVQYDADHPPGYHFVHLLPSQTIIHQHTFPRP